MDLQCRSTLLYVLPILAQKNILRVQIDSFLTFTWKNLILKSKILLKNCKNFGTAKTLIVFSMFLLLDTNLWLLLVFFYSFTCRRQIIYCIVAWIYVNVYIFFPLHIRDVVQLNKLLAYFQCNGPLQTKTHSFDSTAILIQGVLKIRFFFIVP